MTTTREGVESVNADLSADSAADAILKSWMDAGTLSDPDGGAKPRRNQRETNADDEEINEADEDQNDLEDADEDQDDTDDDEGDDQDDEDEDNEDEGDDEDGDEPSEAADEAVVRITVDGEERKIPVKDLKRLYGQEASLTRKSQEVAQARKQAEDEGARYVTAASTLLEKAQERFKPYSTIDWAIAQKTLSNEEFIALRQEAVASYEDLKFLQEDLNSTFEAAKKQRTEALKEAAKEAVRVLADPNDGIPNWSADLYNDIRTFAVSRGLDQEAVDQVTDPNLIKIFHDAMRFRAAQETARTKTRKKAKAAQRTMKSTSKGNLSTKTKSDEALRRLKSTGSAEDAAAAMMAKWSEQAED